MEQEIIELAKLIYDLIAGIISIVAMITAIAKTSKKSINKKVDNRILTNQPGIDLSKYYVKSKDEKIYLDSCKIRKDD